ncbi:MAG: ABC transporter ATP-binding protein [Acidobacteriota bacterium]
MIRLENVSKRFGAIEALAPLDLEIRAREWLGVVGRNGSGKTSLLRILVGLSRPSTGRLLLDGRAPGAEDWRSFRHRLGFMPERIQFHESLTGEKTLQYFARLRGADGKKASEILERVGLASVAKRKVGGYSKGMIQRLNLAQALLGDPEVLVLDEPVEGFDPHGVRLFFDLVRSVKGRTVVFSSHRLPRFSGVVDRICVLSEGRVKALGTESDLSRGLRLPFKVIIHPSTDAGEALESALSRLRPASLVCENGRIVVSVSQADKIAFLSELKGLDAAIRDLRIEEPSLEEVLLETG